MSQASEPVETCKAPDCTWAVSSFGGFAKLTPAAADAA